MHIASQFGSCESYHSYKDTSHLHKLYSVYNNKDIPYKCVNNEKQY